MTANVEYDRITFSLPSSMNLALDTLKHEVSRSKSDIIKLALESYLAQQQKIKLQKAVELMTDEYADDSNFTEFTSLDSEDFA